jgi:hypothetical protein
MYGGLVPGFEPVINPTALIATGAKSGRGMAPLQLVSSEASTISVGCGGLVFRYNDTLFYSAA